MIWETPVMKENLCKLIVVELLKKFIHTFYGNAMDFLNVVNIIVMPVRLWVGIPEWIKWLDTNRTTTVRFPAMVEIFIFTITWKRAFWPTQSPVECLLGVNWPVRKAEHSPSPSIEIQRVWSFTSTICHVDVLAFKGWGILIPTVTLGYIFSQ